MNMSRVQVVTQSSFEHGRVLRNDCQAATEVKQANRGHIETIDTIATLEVSIEDT